MTGWRKEARRAPIRRETGRADWRRLVDQAGRCAADALDESADQDAEVG